MDNNKNTLLKTLEKDSFKINDLAEYKITEFIPSITGKEFEILKENI